MNIYSNVKKLPVLTVILGLAVMALRLLLYGFCQDGRGLVNDGHILSLLVWGLTSFAAVLTVRFVWQLDGSLKYADNFSPSRVSALGAFALAAGIALTLLSSLLWTHSSHSTPMLLNLGGKLISRYLERLWRMGPAWCLRRVH